MLKLLTHLAIWIPIFFLLDGVVIGNKNHLNLQEKEKLAHNSSQNLWEKRLLCKNHSSKLTSSTEVSQLEGDRTEYNRIMKSENEKTLLDYNNPAITGDSDIRSEFLANHIRVKRSESASDSLPHSWFKNNTINVFGELLSTFGGLYADSHHKLESVMIDTTTRTYSHYKRRVLSKNEQYKKRVKGSTGHSKYRIKSQGRDKKRGGLESPRRKSKNTTINMHTRKIDASQRESKIKKRESENSGLNNVVGVDFTDYERMRTDKSETLIKQSDPILLTNNSRPKEQREESSVALPFVHTGKAELRVRIEKIPANESSFINTDNWMDYSTTIGLSSTMSTQSKYGIIDEIINTNVTNSKFASNYTGRERKEMNNTIEFTSLGTQADQNSEDTKYKHINKNVAEFADEDMKYRTKRNPQIMSKHYLQDNTRQLKRLKNKTLNIEQNIEGIKHGRTMYRRARGNRAVRSIEEIKDLVEKLVVKVNELQMYVSNYSEIPHMTDTCVSKKADRTPRLLEKSDYKSEFVRDTDNHERLTNNRQVISLEETAFPIPSSASRITRANSRGRKKLLRKWNRWTDWSSCSVTCGKGRQIRWRHCLRDCDDVEIEMEEKACQLPACPPGKFLGIF